MAVGYRGYEAARELAPAAAPPGTLEIVRVVPEGCRRLLGRAAPGLYRAGLAILAAEAGLRPQALESLLRFAGALAAPMSYRDGTTRDSRDARCREAARSESTWKRQRRRLEEWGALRTVRPGRIYRHGDQARHDAAIYVICLPKRILRQIAARRRRAPAPRETGPPTGSPSQSTPAPPPGTCGQSGQHGPPSGRARSRGRPPAIARLAALGEAAVAMAAVLCRTAGQDITDGWCLHLVRRYLRAGWTARDLERAIDGEPLGQLHRGLRSSMRRPRNVLLWRLGRWADPLGRPFPPPSQLDAYRATRIRQAAAPYSAAAKTRPADPAPYVSWLREQASQGWPQPEGNDHDQSQ
jgi:hypothetical protein